MHARGASAKGFFEVTHDISHLTCADVLRAPGVQTPVIVRFSTVIHERGSPETLRDPRGFAVKFYTREGNWDLVGNNFPVRSPVWGMLGWLSAASLFFRPVLLACAYTDERNDPQPDGSLFCRRSPSNSISCSSESLSGQHRKSQTFCLTAWALLQVFFVRDGMKFPDMVHALKPNPKNHIQEGWRIMDFFSHHPESMNMVSLA